MKLQHFNIYKELSRLGSRVVLIPDLCEAVNDENLVSTISKKTISKFGFDICSADELILRDKSLIDDLKKSDCYFIFLASNDNDQNINDSYWDSSLKLEELVFLGWLINMSINADGDDAVTDGIFPIIFNDLLADKTQMLKIIDDSSLNEWGLIKDEVICNNYVEINKSDVKVIYMKDDGNYQESDTDWHAVGVYCDKYTYDKLRALEVIQQNNNLTHHSSGTPNGAP